MSKPFVLNRHRRLVFPSNFFAELDFSVLETEEQLNAIVHRDFETNSPTGEDILEKTKGKYWSKYGLLRDVALNLFWANRFAITMYEKRPVRWRDVGRMREDIYLPTLTPWRHGAQKVKAVDACYAGLSARWDEDAEGRIHDVLFDIYRNKLHHATELSAIKSSVRVVNSDPTNLVYCLSGHDPNYPTFSYDEILDCYEERPELEALMRLSMVLHNQYPWDRSKARLEEIGKIGDDEFVVLFVPRNRDVAEFIRRCQRPPAPRPVPAGALVESTTVNPVPPVIVPKRFPIQPRVEALAVAKGEQLCTNEDVIRNTAYSWSVMTAEDISTKTGIESRIYTERSLADLALMAATSAVEGSGRKPEEFAAVIFCSCTSSQTMPSISTWLSGELGIFQTHVSFDLLAACAGFPYGISQAVRVLQDINRPVLLVCAEKFSDKIGSVRPSRMIFGDGAAALVIAPTPAGEAGDIEVMQSYASGPRSEVNSIIWPNPEFDNDVTVWGPEVKALVERYLVQMMGEVGGLAAPEGMEGSMVDAIDLVVPHQANRTMVVELAGEAGIPEESLYFNIDRVGNVSAASIPIAIYDAVMDGVIDRPMRLLTPGFGAGAVAGYVVMNLDPAIVVPEHDARMVDEAERNAAHAHATSVEDVTAAFV